MSEMNNSVIRINELINNFEEEKSNITPEIFELFNKESIFETISYVMINNKNNINILKFWKYFYFKNYWYLDSNIIDLTLEYFLKIYFNENDNILHNFKNLNNFKDFLSEIMVKLLQYSYNNALNFISYLEKFNDKPLIYKYKILKLLKLILMKYLNYNIVKEAILIYIVQQIDFINDLIKNNKNILNNIKIIYDTITLLKIIFDNSKSNKNIFHIIFYNEKIKDFIGNSLNYFINKNDNFFLIKPNLFNTQIYSFNIKINILLLYLDIFDYIDKEKLIEFKDYDYFHSVKIILINLLEDFYIVFNNNININYYKNNKSILRFISCFIYIINNFIRIGFFNDSFDNPIFLNLIKLRVVFLVFKKDEIYNFNNKIQLFKKNMDYLFISDYPNICINNIKYNYLLLIKILINNIDNYFSNILKDVYNNFTVNFNTNYDIIFLINILPFIKERNDILEEFKNLIINNIDLIFERNCNLNKFLMIYLLFKILKINFKVIDDFNFVDIIMKFIFKILKHKIINKDDDSILFLIIINLENIILNNKTDKLTINKNVDLLISNKIKTIFESAIQWIIRSSYFNFFGVIKAIILKYIHQINNIDYITNLNKTILTDIIKYSDYKFLIYLYKELINIKVFKEVIDINDLIKNIEPTLMLDIDNLDWIKNFFILTKYFKNINFDSIVFLNKIIIKDKIIKKLLINYLITIFNYDNEDISVIYCLLNSLIKILIKISGLKIENEKIVKILLMQKILHLMDNYFLLCPIIPSSLVINIHNILNLIINNETIYKDYYKSLLNVFYIILMNYGFNLKKIKIDYDKVNNDICNNYSHFFDIFSRFYLIDYYINLTNKIIESMNCNNLFYFGIIKCMFNKIILIYYLNMLEIDKYNTIGHDIKNKIKFKKIVDISNNYPTNFTSSYYDSNSGIKSLILANSSKTNNKYKKFINKYINPNFRKFIIIKNKFEKLHNNLIEEFKLEKLIYSVNTKIYKEIVHNYLNRRFLTLKE